MLAVNAAKSVAKENSACIYTGKHIHKNRRNKNRIFLPTIPNRHDTERYASKVHEETGETLIREREMGNYYSSGSLNEPIPLRIFVLVDIIRFIMRFAYNGVINKKLGIKRISLNGMACRMPPLSIAGYMCNPL